MRQVISFNNKNWELPHIQSDDRFYLIANSASTIAMYRVNSSHSTWQCSLDGENWNNFTTSDSFSLNAGEKLYVRGKLTGSQQSNETQFNISGNVKAVGNIMHLYDYENPDSTTISYNAAFAAMFADHSGGLKDVEELLMPATTLSVQSYANMFIKCGITSSPVLPATTLTQNCYQGMFARCPITKVTMLARTFGQNSLLWWMQSVPSSGTLYKNPLTSVNDFPPRDSAGTGIPYGWTVLDYAG